MLAPSKYIHIPLHNLKILICFDGSKAANDAVRFIGLLGIGVATDITLLHVERCDLCSFMPSLSQRIKNIVRKRSDSVFKKGEKEWHNQGKPL